MKRSIHPCLLKRITLGLVVAAVAAPSAQAYYFAEPGTAKNVPSNEPVWQTIVPGKAFPAVAKLHQARAIPDDTPVGQTVPHAFTSTPGNEPVAPTIVAPDPTRGLPSLDELAKVRFTPESQAPPVVAQAPRGIDWKDAGIGAGIAIGALLLAAAAATGVRRHRGLAHS